METTNGCLTAGNHHTLWIDVLKGIAILLVVYGHNCSDNSFVQAFHMPLFFLLSGFLFSPKAPSVYIKRSFARLAIPYIAFLLTIALPQLLSVCVRGDMGGGKQLILYMIYGGEYLKGPFAVFWFVSVLWLSTNLFNLLLTYKYGIWMLPIFIGLSYLVTLLPIALPLNLHMVPLAVTYIMIGNLIKRNVDWIYGKTKNRMTVLIATSVILLIAVYLYRHELMIDMKYNNPGIPIVSLLSSIIASASVACIAIWLSRLHPIAKFLSFLGEASMIIMFVHMPVKEYLIARFYPDGNHLLSFTCGLIISVAAYWMLNQYDWTRRLFLGQIKPLTQTTSNSKA